MQAIVTKYHGPGVRGSRVSATCESGRVTVGWDDALNPENNHRGAAMFLVKRLGWDRFNTWHGAAMPDGRWAWVPVPK